MAIRVPNLGLGDGKTGDTELKIRQDYNHNFSDQTNAASRLVGTASGQVPLVESVGKIALSEATKITHFNQTNFNIDVDIEVGVRYLFDSASVPKLPPQAGQYVVTAEYGYMKEEIQKAFNKRTGTEWRRWVTTGVKPFSWSAWTPVTKNSLTYTTTTASGANVTVDSAGELMRSTSSERYKNILAPLVLDDAKYAQAISLKPIVYRSTAEADNPNHHYYSFSAEELGAYDPAFTLWRTTEVVTDAEGNITEQPLAEKQAEGININALLAMSHAIAIKQDGLIKKLEARVAALEPKPEV